MANITRRLGRLVRLLAVLGLSFLLLTCDNVLQIGLGDKADIEPPSVTLDSPRDGEYLSGTVRFRGSIADDVEVSKVEVSTNGGQSFAETSFDWEAGTWDHELATTDFPDGEYEFHVRATDQAGRTTTTKALVYVDNAAPAVMVRTPQGIQGSEFNKTISISGDAYDRFGIQHVTLTLTLLDGAGDPVEQLHLRPDLSSWQEAYENNDDRADVADGTNSWTYDFDSTVYSDNDELETGFVEAFAFTVTATDKAGNENDVIFHGDDVRALLGRTPTVNEVYHALATTGVLADSDGDPQPLEESAGEGFSLAINQYLDLPIVEYTTPSPESTEADPDTLGLNPVLSGSVTDDDGIDLGTIEIRVIESEDDTTTPWTTLSGEQISGSGSRVNWTYDLEEAVGPANVQGPHWVELRVDDINGESSPDTGPIFFLVDYGPPQLTETESGITGTSWVYRNEDVPLGGVATDGNVVDSVVATYSKDGGTPVEFLNDTTDDGEWSTNLPISLGDGAYEVTITASDGATTTTINRNIVIDTVSPSLSITAPGSDEAVDTDTYTIRGQATDGNGRGVAALDYSLDFTDDGDDTNDTWHAIDVAGLNWSRAGVDVSAGGQGAKTLTVRAADGLNPYTYESVSFSYDTAAPTLSETSVGTTAQVIRNADFTLSGNVDDTNELASIIITAERDGADMGEVYSASTEGAYTFTRNVAANGDDDGAWQYRITATDTAGRVTQLTRLVLIDATAPDTPTVDPFVGTYAVNELVSSGSTADSGSGVETVEYSFDYTDDGDDTNDTWAPAGGTNSWFRTIDIGTTGADLPEGTHTLFVRATDRAGNRSGVGNRSFIVDRENPIIAVDGFEGTQYRNTSFTIDGTVSDSLELAVDPVSVAVEGPSGAVDLSASPLSYSAGAWSQDVPIDQGDGEYTVTVGAIDSVDRTTEVTRTVVVDTESPSAQFTSVVPVIDESTVNGCITARGVVADARALGDVEWALVAGSGPPDETDYELISGSRTSPEFQIDTISPTDNVLVNGTSTYSRTLQDGQVSSLWIRATDRAGNEAVTSQNLFVDQSSDNPEILFTTMDATANDASLAHLNLIESNALVRFTITDDDLVDASTIEISIGDASSWQGINYNNGTAPTDAKSVRTSHNFYLPSMLAEGTTHFYLRASDDAEAKSGLPAVQEQVGPIYVMIDRNFPIVTETTLGGDAFRSALFGLGGEVSDTNALKNITITEAVDSGSPVEVANTDLAGTSDTWSLADMPSGGVPNDGVYEYTITITDASDKQSALTRTVTIDTTAPQDPVVTTPEVAAWLNSTSFVFQGTASDGAGSGIDSVFFVEAARGTGAPAIGDAAWQEATVDGSGNWSASVSIGAAGEREFHVYSVDEAGNPSAVVTHDFGLDQASPSVAVAGGVATQYENDDFQISGTFTDASGIADVTVETSTDNTTFTAADPANATFDNDAETWSWNRTIGSQADGTYYYRFSFTDNAGNSSQLTKTVNLDASAPGIAFDSAAPSIDFNGTAQTATANGIMSLTGSVTENQGTGNLVLLEYQIDGGGYSELTADSSFTIGSIDTTHIDPTGTMTIDVRAVDRNGNATTESFTFNVDQSTDAPVIAISSPTDGGTVTSTTVSVIGTITDDDGVSGDAGTVQYRYSADGTAGGYGVWQNVSVTGTATSRNFNFEIASATDGMKLIEMRAYDTGGVISATTEISLTVDTDEPEILNLLPAADSYFNGDFQLSGTATDDSGDVTMLRYRVEVDGVEEIGWTNIAGTPAASIDFNETIDTDAAGGGVYEIFLEAGDGTFTRESRVSVFVDLTDPALTFDAPSSASTQNNIISITGAASDNYDVQSVDFRIVDPNTGGTEQELPTGTPSGTTNWSIVGFDTRDETLLTYADDLGGGVYELTLRAIVTDAAGNTYTTAGGDDLVFLIDQATDRPVVTFDEIATDGSSTIETTIIRGSVTDDDGVGAIQVDTYAVDDSVTVESVALTSGSYGDESVDWRITLTGAGNGTRGIRVQATDTVDNDPNSSTDTGRIDFQLDTEDPDVAIDAPASNVTWSGNDTFTVSGTSGDETGVTAIAYKVDDNDFSSGTTSVPDGAGNDWATWEFTIDQSSLADGPHTIYVQATDSVGNTRVASRQVSVDKTAPTVTIVSPSNGEAVFGPLTIGGTAADNSGGAGVDSIAIGLGKQIDPGDLEGSTWTSVAGTTSWSFDFLNINDYANTTYSVNTGDTDGDGIEDGDETWTDLWNFTFYVRAVDSAGESGDGNVSYLTSYTLQIDPKRDRPEVTILSPSDGDTVGGFVRVFGSAFDSQFVEKVQIAIDANNNGDYTDDTWAEGTLDETDAGTNWYLADGTTSWSVRLNENSEFNPTGADETRTIAFKVRAKDYKTTPGDGIYGAEVEYSITFNKSFPQFSAMSLESGATVGGTVTLSGLVRDETDLNRIVFSNEGPLLDNTTIFQNPGSLVQETFNQDVSSAAATSAGITVEMLGTGDPEFPSGYTGRVYRVNIPIDTEAAGLYPNGAGSMSVKLTAEDVTASPFTNQYLLSLSVDNVDPSDLAYTGAAEIVGTEAELQGTVRDTGTVSGIDRLVVYVTNAAGEIVRLQGGSGAIAGFVEADVLNEADATYDDYRMVIDNRLEEGNDSGAAGDGDGIPEHLTLSAGTYQWSGLFDSTLVDDGVVTVHVMAEDYAGNASSTTSAAFVANNRPVIDSIVLGTDLDGNTTVEADEYTSPITTGFAATNYTARNDLLYIGVNASGGNGTLRFSVTHEGVEQNATLVNNTLVIDTSDELYESSSPNDQAFVITVYDSTSSDNADPTNELSDSITVNLTIDNDDETAPTLSVAPLGRIYNETSDDADKALQAVADYEENIAMSGDDRLGHVEYATDSLYNGADADVSGTVIFRGKVEDDQNIGLITARIPGYNGGAAFNIYDGAPLSGPDWEFTVDGAEYLTDTYGHAFNWSFQWNTASLAGVVADDLEIEFTVYDASNNDNLVAAAVPPEAEIVVDVVPYITSLARDGAYNTIRSRQGWYVFRRAETVTVNGFNLSSGGTDTIVFGAGTSVAVPDGSTTSFSVEVPVDAASGELQLIVDGIPALNNVNDNTPDWNREASLAHPGSDLWTDDRYVHIWQSDDTDAGNNRGYFTGSDDPEYPAMTIDGTGVLYASWSNYADARIWYGPNNGGPDDVYRAYDPSEHTDIHYGARPSVVWNANLYGNGTWDPAGAGGVYVWDANANAALTGTGNAYESELLYHDQRLMQFVNQRIVTSGNDIHVSYYDAETKAMKYWHHTSNTNPPYSTSWINLDGGYDPHDGTFVIEQIANYGWWEVPDVSAINTTVGDTVNAGDNLVSLSNGDTVTASVTGTVEEIFVEVGQAVDNTRAVAIVEQYDRVRDHGGASRSTAAGEFSAIDVTPTNNYPVVAYYDITNSTVRLARSTATNPDATQWAVQDVMDTNDANYDFSGKYISMRIDSQGYVHLAFFRNSSGDLVYMKSTNNPTDGSTAYIFGDSVTVDSNGSVGVWADVTLLNDRPYISYLDSSLVNTFDGAKLAYYDPALEVETGDNAGEPDTADGWEYMNAPMNYEVESVRTSIEADVGSDNFWTAAIGYSSSDYYRIGYYVE